VDALEQLDAARLALLTLRASVGGDTPLPEKVRIFGDFEILTSDAAAHILSGAPKPLICTAVPSPDAMEIQCLPLEPGTRDFDWYSQCRATDREQGGFMGHLTRRRPVSRDDLSVYCVGRGETFLVSLAAVERWALDYFVKRVNCRGDDVNNHFCAEWPEYREAKQRGAAGILMFSSPADQEGLVLMVG